MKLIIDIPEEEFNECKMQVDMIKQEGFLIESLNTALKIHVANGTEPRKGRWIKISPAGIYECSECGQNVMTSDIVAYKFCHGCGADMTEPTKADKE